MSNATILSAGERALLIEVSSPADVFDLTDALARRTPAGVEDFLPAARTVLVTCTATADLAEVRRALLELARHRNRTTTPPDDALTVTIPVHYDGPDLDDVARILGMTRAETISLHTGNRWRCAFIGFAPGFAYLTPDDRPMDVPRRRQSRTAVPAGSVAVAGGYSAVYPRASPGGWHVVGTTDLSMWDLDAEPPATVQPGTAVRFVDATTL
ncbi:KipI family sensor histidine kinase inhibitor [Rhodococcus sp. 27YEA15]|uniref:5-oxoprolinase subunit B family protein n=1 Tax=Rhodococcus sp. 27YEA15 TaxID=3156259 RepID=UPI003C7C7B60